MINSREDIKNYILSIERDYHVNEWKVNDVHLWPIIRIRLLFELVKKKARTSDFESDLRKSEIKRVNPIVFKVQRLKQFISTFLKKNRNLYNHKKWLKSLKSVQNVYVGHDSFRVNYKGKRFNRFFDVLIGESNNYLFIDHDKKSVEGKYRSDHLLVFQKEFQNFKRIYKSKKYNFSWEGYDLFLKNLEEQYNVSFLFQQEKIEEDLKINFLPKMLFFKDIFQKITPENVAVLCYYNETVMAIIAAANQLGVKTIDMQHGPQTDIHLAYSDWSKIPRGGYNVLPREFWCWDKNSEKTLDNWMNKCQIYSSKVIGNPWVNYWKRKANNYQYKGFILYSLQPNPVTMEELFPEELISFIHSYSYKWFLRLHPRQLHEQKKIENYLAFKKVLHLVNIENATKDHLPQLLVNSLLHVTNFSGTTIEASLLDKKTVLISMLGVQSFPELIQQGKAIYLDTNKHDFKEKMIHYLSTYC